MATIDVLRDNIIDKLLTKSNKEYLSALNQLVESSSVEKGFVNLSAEQISMLKISDQDIENGRLISQDQLDKNDLEWLKGK